MKRKSAKVINKREIMHYLKMEGPIGWLLTTLGMSALGINKVNKVYDAACRWQGPEFSRKVLEILDVTCDIKKEQLSNIPLDAPFITVSNHSYGSIDGLILSAYIGSLRPYFKIMTNFILSKVPNLTDTFLPVNPFTDGSVSRSSFKGLRMAKTLLSDGGGLGLFPAGEVATYQKKERRSSVSDKKVVEDIPWSPNMVKLIASSGVTVVPIYFHGGNSKLFHFLGKIHPMLRTAMLIWELLNKKGQCVPVRIGKPILPTEIADIPDQRLLGGYLRNRVYALEAEFTQSETRQADPSAMETIASPVDRETLVAAFEAIKDKALFDTAQYRCYLADYEDIPDIIPELGRCREEAFRATGEGSGKAVDTDEYDRYYKHLILFDTSNNMIAGAYRIGVGSEILSSGKGFGGFYTASLFGYKDSFAPYLNDSLELGRSFVSVGYQKEALPLMLLLKGLMYTVMKYPRLKYFLGPVSISNWYPKFYQSLMVKFIGEHYPMDEAAGMVSPTTPFTPDYIRVNPVMLLCRKVETIEQFDRLLMKISAGEYRLPTLVKKYIKMGAKFICFNVDPLFNYSLDGLIMLKFTDFPKQDLLSMTRDLTDDSKRAAILERFGYNLD